MKALQFRFLTLVIQLHYYGGSLLRLMLHVVQVS